MKTQILIFIFCTIFSTSSLVSAKTLACALHDENQLLEVSKKRSEEALHQSDLREKSRLAVQGIEFADRCLKKDKSQVGCYYYRAVNRGLDLETRVVRVKKELKLMMADFNKVIELDPSYDNGGAYQALGYVFLKAPKMPVLGKEIRRDLNKAMAYAQKSLKVAPRDTHNLKLAGEVAYKQKNFSQALNFFKEALKSSKKNQNQNFQVKEVRQGLKKWVKKARKKVDKNS